MTEGPASKQWKQSEYLKGKINELQ